MITIREILKNTYSQYKLSPIDSGILLSLATNMPNEYILAHPEKNLTELQKERFENFSKRRSRGEPVAYITGKKEFYGLEFGVDKNVLIPRPETEMLVEYALSSILRSIEVLQEVTIIDVGTGSGNIIVSIAKNIPKKIQNTIKFFAVDVSESALNVAKQNSKKHKVFKNIKFVRSDVLKYFQRNKIKTDNLLVVANLPYVSQEIYKKNIRNLKFEPKKSLLSQKNGLHHYEKLLIEISEIQKKNSIRIVQCFLEFSPEQKPEIGRIIRKYLPDSIVRFIKDLAGKWRIAHIESLK